MILKPSKETYTISHKDLVKLIADDLGVNEESVTLKFQFHYTKKDSWGAPIGTPDVTGCDIVVDTSEKTPTIDLKTK